MWSAQAQLIWIKPENKKAENHNGGELVIINKQVAVDNISIWKVKITDKFWLKRSWY